MATLLILLSIENTFMVSIIGYWVINLINVNKELKKLEQKTNRE